jgi:hypothetical protein
MGAVTPLEQAVEIQVSFLRRHLLNRPQPTGEAPVSSAAAG